MDSERWELLKDILNEVGDLPAGQRQAYLYEACRGDAGMLREAQSLLDFDDDSLDSFIEEPLWSVKPEESDDKNIGRQIGPYRIQGLLGRGGMGSVYLAVRQDDFDQRVALKLVNPGSYTQEILDRFLNERQILAHLEHPSIARLLDGGTTDDDLPYFVLEYVDGVPIDQYCETNKLSVPRRLELFRQVCSAVHVAHQSLVVHRDIKPSNILITPDGVPKLLDFGIAKILRPSDNGGRQQAGIAARGLETEAGHHPMTPNYASPEQILDEVITTASDVYSLGVLLYRLLSRHAPYQLTGASFTEKIRKVCNEEPTRPSVMVQQHLAGPTGRSVAAGSSGKKELRRLRRRLAGDLDAIVLKAMRKEPQNRYHSVEQLSDDIRRHLKGIPVLARQGTWTYLTNRYVRRHNVGLSVGFLSLVFAVSSTFLWRQAVEERAQAERERNRAETVVEFLDGLFDAADPDATQGREVTVREILDRGREEIAEGLETEVETQANLLRTLGTLYIKLGLYDEARDLKERAVEARRQTTDGDDPELATDIANLATVIYSLGDYETAEEYYNEALEMRRRLDQSDAEIAATLNNLALAKRQQGAFAEAEVILQEVLDIRIRLLGAESLDAAVAHHSLGGLYHELGELPEADTHLRRALEVYRTALGDDEHTYLGWVHNSLGRVLEGQGKYEEAESSYKQALEIQRKRLGEEHADLAATRKNFAALLLAQGEIEAAQALLEQALTVLRTSKSEASPILADAENLMGWCLAELGRYEEAETRLIESYGVIRNAKGEHSIYSRNAARRIVKLYEAWGRPELGEEYRRLADTGR